MTSPELKHRFGQDTETERGFLVFDCESIPDGELIARLKYPDLTPAEAIEKARAEARETSFNGSDFLPVSFQIPVAVCVVRVGYDLKIRKITCLDRPAYRPKEIARQFWKGVENYKKMKLVTFNGRTFDVPLLELAAFRHGFSLQNHLLMNRNRFSGNHLDLMEWMTNFGAFRLTGGLNLMSKLIGKPGKMETAGDQVFEMYQAGQLAEINDYCLCDTLDTYFAFLRTRVMTGDITAENEIELLRFARGQLIEQRSEYPILSKYLSRWSEAETLGL